MRIFHFTYDPDDAPDLGGTVRLESKNDFVELWKGNSFETVTWSTFKKMGKGFLFIPEDGNIPVILEKENETY